MKPATQDWVHDLTIMQQSVLLGAIRGPDGMPKYHVCKFLTRWYRRCVLVSALDGRVLLTPYEPGGGSFTGPSYSVGDCGSPIGIHGLRTTDWPREMESFVGYYLQAVDELPHHFQMHFMHAAEILGYKHPNEVVRTWWAGVYRWIVHDFHLWPESEEQLDSRLGDDRSGWLARADEATAS